MTAGRIALPLFSALALSIGAASLGAPPPDRGGGKGGGNDGGGDNGGSTLAASFPALGSLPPTLTEDGLGLYVDGVDKVETWFNGPGNLKFNTGNRTLHVTLDDTSGTCAFSGPSDPVSNICVNGRYFDGFFPVDSATHCRTDADSIGACDFPAMTAGESKIFQIRFTIETHDDAVYKLRFGTECLADPDSGVRRPDHSNELIMYYDGTNWSFDSMRLNENGILSDVTATLCRDVTTGKGKKAVTETVWTGVTVSFDVVVMPM